MIVNYERLTMYMILRVCTKRTELEREPRSDFKPELHVQAVIISMYADFIGAFSNIKGYSSTPSSF